VGRRLAVVVAAGLLAACAGSTGVVPPGERSVEVYDRAVSLEGRHGAVRVTERRWSAPPQRVLLHHTPVWVVIRSISDQTVRLEPETWSLVVEGDASPTPAVGLERLVSTASGSLAETRLIRGQGLRPRSLEPGETARGFVFFRRRFADDEQGRPVTLRIVLQDADGALEIESLAVPLRAGP
jgi:hypothetical protein